MSGHYSTEKVSIMNEKSIDLTSETHYGTMSVQKRNQRVNRLYYFLCFLEIGCGISLMVTGGYYFSNPVGSEIDIINGIKGIFLFISGLPFLIGALICLGSGLRESGDLWQILGCLSLCIVATMFLCIMFAISIF